MPHRYKLFARLTSVLAALLLVAAACGDGNEKGDSSGQNGQDSRYGGSIVVGLEGETNTWTPGKGQFASAGKTIAHAIFDPLVWFNEDGEYEGFLAESIEANDDITVWTLKLRDGVKFHDGTVLDAEVLKWNFDNLHFTEASSSYGYLIAAGFEEFEIIDDLTVAYNLSEPNSAFPDLLRGGPGLPVSKEAYEADPEGFGEKPVGTGPFIMEEWRRDDRVVVKRNDDYWFKSANGDQLPYLDEITFKVIPDEESRYQSLASGDVTMMQTRKSPTIRKLENLAAKGAHEVPVEIGNKAEVVLINVLEAPVDDVRVRQALAYLGDADAERGVLDSSPEAQLASGYWGKGSPWYSESAADVSPGAKGRDVDAAKALIEEYINDPNRSDGKELGSPVEVTISCGTEVNSQARAQLYQSLWGDAGVETKIDALDIPTLIGNVVGSADTEVPFSGDFMMACWSHGAMIDDPLSALQYFFGDVATQPGNFTNYTNPEIDAQLKILKDSNDYGTRFSAVDRIQAIAAENVPLIWSIQSESAVAYSSKLHGIPDWKLPSGSPGTGNVDSTSVFYQAYLEK